MSEPHKVWCVYEPAKRDESDFVVVIDAQAGVGSAMEFSEVTLRYKTLEEAKAASKAIQRLNEEVDLFIDEKTPTAASPPQSGSPPSPSPDPADPPISAPERSDPPAPGGRPADAHE